MTEELKHSLVPEHTKLSTEEKEELLKQYRVTTRELPKISNKDPAIKHIEVVAGDVIKIMRNSSTSEESTFYRGVTDE